MQSPLASRIVGTTRFVIERELGQGGMGVVYQALDTERGTRVALKSLTQRDAVHIYRLKNEFRQLADLSHPNLVTLHELVQEGDTWFFTMELVEGGPFDEHCAGARPSLLPTDSRLQTRARRFLRDASVTLSPPPIGSELSLLPRTPCDVQRVRPALRQLVEAVAALHAAGKLHRDLKPANVLVTPLGRVVVLDFGLVSSSPHVHEPDPDRTVGGCVFGTPAYMSPEQSAGEPLTPTSDWYSVGVMLYEVLTGRLPFDGSVLEILRQKEEAEPPPPSEVVQGVPDDLDQLCRELLRRDPKRRPSGAEILRYLTGHTLPLLPVLDAQSGSWPLAPGDSFVGRAQQLSELRSAFEASSRGKPLTVLVHGHSGIGKSALVRYFCNELIARNEAIVLRGRCYERESVPYKAFDDIADALGRYLLGLADDQAAALMPRAAHALPRLFPVLRRVRAIATAPLPKHAALGAVELRNQAFGALKELLCRICDRAPLVINIDDLQWADLDSARLLSFLLAPPDPPPMLLVGTYRRDEVAQSSFLSQVLREGPLADGTVELRSLAVEALSDAEAEALVGAWLQHLHADDPELRRSLAAEAEGIPFFIGELVQHEGLRARSGDGAARQASPSLDQVLLERVRSMPEAAQQLLHVLAVASGPLEQGVAIEAAGLPRGDRAATLVLRAARLIRTRGTRERDTAEPYHDRIRETVTRALSPASLRDLHARIAAALERHDIRNPERLMVHYAGAGDVQRAAEAAMDAAHAAARKLAFNRAAELFDRCLELLPPGDSRRGGLHERLGEAFAHAGKGAQAAEAYLVAAHSADGPAQRALRTLAAQQFLRSGRIDEGTQLARALYREVGLRFPSSAFGALFSLGVNSARLALMPARSPTTLLPAAPSSSERLQVLGATFRELGLHDVLQGAALQTLFQREAMVAGDVDRTLQGLAWKAWRSAILTGDRRAAFGVLARVDELAAARGTPYALATASSARAGCHLFLRDLTEVAGHAQAAESALEQCPGTHWERSLTRAYRLTAIEHVGGYASMVNKVPSWAAEARERRDYLDLLFTSLFMAFAELVADRPAEALECLDALAAILPRSYGSFHVMCAFRQAHVLLYQGRPLEALRHMQAEDARFRASTARRALFYRVAMHSIMGRVYIAAADADRAGRQEWLSAALTHARALAAADQPHTRGLSQCLLAEVAHRRGDHERTRDHLSWCVERVDLHRAPMLAHYARRALGSVLGGDEGARLVADADVALRAEGVVDASTWSKIWVNV